MPKQHIRADPDTSEIKLQFRPLWLVSGHIFSLPRLSL